MLAHLRRGGFPFIVLAFFDSSLLRTHFWPFTGVLQEIRREVTRKVWENVRRAPSYARTPRRPESSPGTARRSIPAACRRLMSHGTAHCSYNGVGTKTGLMLISADVAPEGPSVYPNPGSRVATTLCVWRENDPLGSGRVWTKITP